MNRPARETAVIVTSGARNKLTDSGTHLRSLVSIRAVAAPISREAKIPPLPGISGLPIKVISARPGAASNAAMAPPKAGVPPNSLQAYNPINAFSTIKMEPPASFRYCI